MIRYDFSKYMLKILSKFKYDRCIQFKSFENQNSSEYTRGT